jgi:hypothetical protein
LEYWKIFFQLGGNKLYFLAEKFLTIPSERVFSSGGKICTDYRINLDDFNIEKLVLLKENIEYIPKTETEEIIKIAIEINKKDMEELKKEQNIK